MGQYNLSRIFKPNHIAVVGASEKFGGGVKERLNRRVVVYVTQ